MEGNSTNTVNTVEETEYSSNDKKGIEATTTFNKVDEVSFLRSMILRDAYELRKAIFENFNSLSRRQGWMSFMDVHPIVMNFIFISLLN